MQVRNLQRSVVRSAFTLMELLVVVAILVVLAGVGGYYYLRELDNAKVNAARIQVKATLTQAAEAYYTKHGEWPTSLAALTEKDADGSRPYLDPEAIKSPWGTPYQYDPSGPNNNGNKPDIWADGPQGRIGNWSGQKN